MVLQVGFPSSLGKFADSGGLMMFRFITACPQEGGLKVACVENSKRSSL